MNTNAFCWHLNLRSLIPYRGRTWQAVRITAFRAVALSTILSVFLLGIAVNVQAVNTHGLGSEARERAAWFYDRHSSYVTSGCLWAIPSSSLTLAAVACQAYVSDGTDELVYVEQAATTITIADATPTWVAVRSDRTTIPAGWTDVSLTHYIYRQSASKPATPSGTMIVLQATVAASVISALSQEEPLRLIHEVTTVAASTTVGKDTVWEFSPEGELTVASGTTTTFHFCPFAPRSKIFDADRSSTGTIAFAAGACGVILPEWWGADPTGVVDATAIFADVIAAGTFAATIELNGEYRISATSPNAAIVLEDGVQLEGVYIRGNATTGEANPSKLLFYGTGTAVRLTDLGGSGTTSHRDVRFQNIMVEDVDDTADIGIELFGPQSMRLVNVLIVNFDTGLHVLGNVWYGVHRLVRIRNSRTAGAIYTGAMNGAEIEIGITTSDVTVTCFDFGSVNVSHGAKLDASVECPNAATNILIARQRGLDARIYMEMGTGGTTGVSVTFTSGNIFMFGQGDTGVSRVLLVSTRTTSSSVLNAQHLKISGWIDTAGATADVEVIQVGGDQMEFHAVDLSGLHFDRSNSTVANFVGGHYVGMVYHTTSVGNAPVADVGAGSSTNSVDWRVGDMAWNSSQTVIMPHTVRNVVAGNPGTWAGHSFWRNSRTTMTSTDVTPTVLGSNILATAGTTAITGFDDGVLGQILIVQAETNITVTDGAPIVLNGSANYAMTTGDTLMLICRTGGASSVFWEIARSVN